MVMMSAEKGAAQSNSETSSEQGGFRAWLENGGYLLPLKAWNSTASVLMSILSASFIVNLLSLVFPLALLQVYDRIIPNNAMSTLTLLVVLVGIALVLEAFFRVARSYVGAWADAKFEHVTGCRAFKRMLQSSLLEYEKEGSGIHLKRMNALGMLREYYAGQALISVGDIPFILIILLVILYIGVWLVFIPIVIVLIYIFITLREARNLQSILENKFSHDERRFNFIIETLGNIHTVKAVTMEAQMQRRYERLEKLSAVYDYDLSMKSSVSSIAGISVSQIMVILIVACGSILVVQGQLTIGGLAACTLLSGRCLQPINQLIGVWTRLQTIKIAHADLKKILNMKRESRDNLPKMPKSKGGISVEDLSFRYGEKESWIFENLNFSIEPNEAIAITGEGLSGKSTLIWLLLGLFRPNKGKVLIDHQEIDQFNIDSVRKQIAYLPQKATLFKGTIMDNLTMFEENKYRDYAIKICQIMGIDSVIERLPKGYDTMVADQAIDTLSKGVCQRIAIARALIKNPRIIVFDEANTAMDMQSDSILFKVLEQLKGQRTLILITHRPSILKLADRTFKLEQGQMRELND